MKHFCFTFLLCSLLSWVLPAYAEGYTAVIPVQGSQVEICTSLIMNEEEETEEHWLFLPSFAELSSLSIQDSELSWQLLPHEEEQNMWIYEGKRGETVEGQIFVMQSAHLRTMFLFSDDPENAGRAYIESDPLHQLEATGTLAMVNVEGKVDYAGKVRQIRGRGGSTWELPKKSYQIKLEDKYDLLQTGDSEEYNRSWCLISNAYDGSLLHNQIAMDLALEMGLSGNARNEQVDLYYDGEYRGTYLLTEKLEVSNGRTEGISYENLLKKWNRWAGQSDLDDLPILSAVNRFGDTYFYADNLVDNGTVDAGTYLVEFRRVRVAEVDRSSFILGYRQYEVKDPKYGSQEMMRYVSERFSEAFTSLQNQGVHPETGRKAEELLDMDGFARMLLVYELGYNMDGFLYASTHFVLPAGGGPIQPGPVWDFDDAMRHKRTTLNAGYGQGLKVEKVRERRNLMYDFYETPVFTDALQKICINEFYPLVKHVLLGNEDGVYLKSMDKYVQNLRASARMNDRLWKKQVKDPALLYVLGFEQETKHLRLYLEQRIEWLYQVMGLNGGTGTDHINVTMRAEWAYPQEALHFEVLPWSRASVREYTHKQVTEATEEEYALWQVEAVFVADEGFAFSDDTSVLINNAELQGELQEDGTLLVSFLFEDHSYRPVDYYGEDIGLIFNPEYYAFNHPEALEACNGNEDLLMDYFCDEGIYMGHRGNGFFDPAVIAFYLPYVAREHGDDLPSLYWDFLYYGFEEENWFESVDALYVPPVQADF